jgi:hypothetical protein
MSSTKFKTHPASHPSCRFCPCVGALQLSKCQAQSGSSFLVYDSDVLKLTGVSEGRWVFNGSFSRLAPFSKDKRQESGAPCVFASGRRRQEGCSWGSGLRCLEQKGQRDDRLRMEPSREGEDKRDLGHLTRGVHPITQKDSVPAQQSRGCPSVVLSATAILSPPPVPAA